MSDYKVETVGDLHDRGFNLLQVVHVAEVEAREDEIIRLQADNEALRARVAELSHLCERLQHCAQGFYVDQGDHGHMEAIMLDYHAIMRGDATHPTDSGQRGGA